MALFVRFLNLLAVSPVLVAWSAMAADPPAAPAPQTTATVNGQIFYQTMCIQCHGAKGEGNELVKGPSIAGRPAWYIERQVNNFRVGRRGTNPKDEAGKLMRAFANILQPEQVKAVAEVISKMPFVPPVQSRALKNPDIEEGRYVFMERCAQCHRFNATGEMTFGSPPLIGLQDWYLLAQITKFKTGWRGADPEDPNGVKMQFSSQYIESEEAKHNVVAFILSLNPKPEVTTTDTTGADSLFDAATGSKQNEPQNAAR